MTATTIDPRDVIIADWDSENPSQEPWRIDVPGDDGKPVTVYSGHDLRAAVAMGFHREADRLHREARESVGAKERSEREASERAEFEDWKRARDDPDHATRVEAEAKDKADFDAFIASRSGEPAANSGDGA